MNISETPRMLVVSPHPDDEAIYFGGAIAKFASEGGNIRLLTLTDGSKGKIAVINPLNGELQCRPAELEDLPWFIEQRKNETLESARILGVDSVKFLGIPDKGINVQVIRPIRDEIKSFNPHIILSFSEAGSTGPYNPDHSWSGISTYYALKSLLEEEYGYLSNLDRLPHEPPFSFRKYLTYTLPTISERFERWAELATKAEELIGIRLNNAIKDIKGRAMLIHTSQSHLVQFFIRSGLIDLDPEVYLKRISIGRLSDDNTDLLLGTDEKDLTFKIEEIPGGQGRYVSTDNNFYTDLIQRTTKAEEAIYTYQENELVRSLPITKNTVLEPAD